MNATALFDELDKLLENKIMDPIFVKGKSGIGKTSVMDQVLLKHGYSIYQVRWGELAPVDARGVPVADHATKTTRFYTPDFWPREGCPPSAIVMDEYNMASTGMMALGQRLFLERRFGDYRVPDNVIIWGAGNRKSDMAAVNEVPAPTNNRLAHYELDVDVEAWKIWASSAGLESDLIGFIEFRPELLHKFDKDKDAWPSPRSWEMADRRIKVNMDVEPVVGEGAAVDFRGYKKLLKTLPKITEIVSGRGAHIKFPEEPSQKYAVVAGLRQYALKEWQAYANSFRWLIKSASDEREWVQGFVMDVMKILQRSDPHKNREYLKQLDVMPEAKNFLDAYLASMAEEKGVRFVGA